MLNTTKTLMVSVAVALVLTVASFAQTGQTTNPESEYVTEKGFKSKVFEVKFRDADSLRRVLLSLCSGFKGATIVPSSEFKTLTVRDFPENIAAIEEALKRLDTPAAPRPNIELHMHVLIASNTAGNTAKPPPAELKDVLTQLSQTLNYGNYELATSIVQRITDTPRGFGGKGTTEISSTARSGSVSPLTMSYVYGINAITLASVSIDGRTIQIGEFSFSTALAGGGLQTQVQTALNLRDGEKVVVGTAAFGERALIIVLTAKMVN